MMREIQVWVNTFPILTPRFIPYVAIPTIDLHDRLLMKHFLDLQNRRPKGRPCSVIWCSPKGSVRKIFSLKNPCQETIFISGNQPSWVEDKAFVDNLTSWRFRIPRPPAALGLQISSHELKCKGLVSPSFCTPCHQNPLKIELIFLTKALEKRIFCM